MKQWQERLAEPVDTPAVVVHYNVLEQNIRDMAAFAMQNGVHVRPHVKTHKTTEIAALQMRYGAVGLTCAKLGEAELYLAQGFREVLVAYPLVGATKLARLFDLLARYPHAHLQTIVDSAAQAEALAHAATQHGVTLPVWVKIDSGLRRCGVQPGQEAVELVRTVRELPALHLMGLLTHAGHAYAAASAEQVRAIGQAEAECLLQTAKLLQAQGMALSGISVGSTPTVQVSGAVPGVTEIRPGNYVFCDATQVRLGVTTADRCALRVFTTVVSRPAPDRIVIDAGAKTLALDKGAHGSDAVQGYGTVVGHSDFVIERLSEEHGVVRIPAASTVQLGDCLEIIPNHACPVVNLTDELLVLHEDGRTERWTVQARGKTK